MQKAAIIMIAAFFVRHLQAERLHTTRATKTQKPERPCQWRVLNHLKKRRATYVFAPVYQKSDQTTNSVNALIIFLKNPEKGKAKTRLAAGIGEDAALEAYIELLSHTRNIVLKVDAERFLFYKDEIWKDEWNENDFRKHLQPSGDLGDKMKTAFDFVLKAGAKKVVIIGSDCGELNANIIQQAFDELENQDIVIGPAEDGGYYLLGMKKLHHYLFKNKKWSTEELLDQSIRDIHTYGHTFTLLKELYDIDTIDEWNRWKNIS